MKIDKLIYKVLISLSLLVAPLFFVACEDDDSSSFNNESLDVLITQAQNLIDSSVEGVSPGDFKPGSIAELKSVVEWAVWKKDNSDKQADIADAAAKLKIYIDKFISNDNKVALAIPYIPQNKGDVIEISAETKAVTGGSFTIEAKFYIINLQQSGYCNTMFSNEMGNGGANDRGFCVRYFGDGGIQVNVGGDGWKETARTPNTIKDGEWVHVTAVIEANSQILYINGVQVASQNEVYKDSDAEFPLSIGNSPAWNDRVANSMVKDVRLWNVVLTPQQVKDNMSKTLTGTEAGLELFLPLNADLGIDFSDNTGKAKANFKGDVKWLLNGTPPVIVLDYAPIDAAILSINSLKKDMVEGTNDGDFPAGTITVLTDLVVGAESSKKDAIRQDQLDNAVKNINKQMSFINSNKVADSDGIYVDREDSDAVGLRITPNFTPTANYTVEFDLKLKTLKFEEGDNGEIFGNGSYGLRVWGYNEVSEENIINSGKLWNFTDRGDGWKGAKSSGLAVKPGAWQHVAIVYNQTAKNVIIYVDGVAVATETEVESAPNVSGWGEIWLGNSWGGKMNGSIKDFRIWNVAKSVSELNASISGSESNLEMYFPLEKVQGLKFSDKTGNYKGEMKGVKWNK